MNYRGIALKKSCVIRDQFRPFILSNKILCDITGRLLSAVNYGLSKEGHDDAEVKCFLSYVQDFPTGNETGEFLVVDLGGANFDILLVTLLGERKYKTDFRTYAFPAELLTGTADQFFDHIAESIEIFRRSLELKNEEYLLTFCFGFPVEKTSLNQGNLTSWTKKFNIPNVVGKDIVHLLQAALDSRKLNITVKALINDTVGCLMSSAYEVPTTRLSVIVGTGTNACYVEKIENVVRHEDKSKPNMLINTEWGNFGDDGSINDIITDLDRKMDKTTMRPGHATFEKLVSGLYLCELIRISLIECAEMQYLFHGEVSDMLRVKHCIHADDMYAIAGDDDQLKNTNRVLENLGLNHHSPVDCVNVRYIVKVVCRRSAYLVSACITTLINKMSLSPITISIQGGMFRDHPTYLKMVKEKVECMINPNIRFDLMMPEEGSAVGSAVVIANTD